MKISKILYPNIQVDFDEYFDIIYQNPKKKYWLKKWFECQRTMLIVNPPNVIEQTQRLYLNAMIFLDSCASLNEILDYKLIRSGALIKLRVVHLESNCEEFSFKVEPSIDETVDFMVRESMKLIKKQIDNSAEEFLKK